MTIPVPPLDQQLQHLARRVAMRLPNIETIDGMQIRYAFDKYWHVFGANFIAWLAFAHATCANEDLRRACGEDAIEAIQSSWVESLRQVVTSLPADVPVRAWHPKALHLLDTAIRAVHDEIVKPPSGAIILVGLTTAADNFLSWMAAAASKVGASVDCLKRHDRTYGHIASSLPAPLLHQEISVAGTKLRMQDGELCTQLAMVEHLIELVFVGPIKANT